MNLKHTYLFYSCDLMREGIVSAKMYVGRAQTRNDQRRVGVFGRRISSGKMLWKNLNIFVVRRIQFLFSKRSMHKPRWERDEYNFQFFSRFVTLFLDRSDSNCKLRMKMSTVVISMLFSKSFFDLIRNFFYFFLWTRSTLHYLLINVLYM